MNIEQENILRQLEKASKMLMIGYKKEPVYKFDHQRSRVNSFKQLYRTWNEKSSLYHNKRWIERRQKDTLTKFYHLFSVESFLQNSSVNFSQKNNKKKLFHCVPLFRKTQFPQESCEEFFQTPSFGFISPPQPPSFFFCGADNKCQVSRNLFSWNFHP